MTYRQSKAFLRGLILLAAAVGFVSPMFSTRAASASDELKLGESDLLTIGSPAPELDIKHWIFDGEGKYQHIKKFAEGKVYVVEFWATWCGPCVASMPHLASMQQQYAGKGVQILSVSDEDLETIQEFLTRKTPASQGETDEASDKPESKAQTFADLCKVYCLTTDPDGSTGRDYMEAARQNGIPTSFIVGKDGKIEWIGHPMGLDEPLKAVVSNKWDRAKFAEELRVQQEMERTMQRISLAVRRNDHDQAITLIDQVTSKIKQVEKRLQLLNMKLQILVSKGDVAAATTHLTEVLKSLEDPQLLNVFTWSVFEMSESTEVDKTILGVAATSAEKAASKAEKELKGSLLDTAAHLRYKRGELDKAISLELDAAPLASDQDRRFIVEFLKQLEEEKAAIK